MLGASPPITSPNAKSSSPITNNRATGASTVRLVAGEHDANHRAEEERVGDPAVPGHPTEVGLDVGEDGRDRERLERHERDDCDEPDLQAPASAPDGGFGVSVVTHVERAYAVRGPPSPGLREPRWFPETWAGEPAGGQSARRP